MLLGRWRPEGRPGRLISSHPFISTFPALVGLSQSRPQPCGLCVLMSRPGLVPGTARTAPSYQSSDSTHSSTCMLSQCGCLASLSPHRTSPLVALASSHVTVRRDQREWNIWISRWKFLQLLKGICSSSSSSGLLFLMRLFL